MARDPSRLILATPNQASKLFGADGPHPVRQKGLFAIRFLRKVGDGGDEWKNGLTFVVKSIERPNVQPVLEEINQYNRKRVIQTGVKYSPVSCTLYDTADGAAMNMWMQYASYYFGDYRQTAGQYQDDILNDEMLGRSTGYGFGIPKVSTEEPGGINSQFFFDKIEVYQLWGREYTSYELLNPKISGFTPDELDYEQSAVSQITMAITYEGIYHTNGGLPMAVSSNESLVEMFGGKFSGEVVNPVGSQEQTNSFTSRPREPGSSPDDVADLLRRGLDLKNVLRDGTTARQIFGLLGDDNEIIEYGAPRNPLTTSFGGALSKFGNFNFGDFNALAPGLGTELALLTGLLDTNSYPYEPFSGPGSDASLPVVVEDGDSVVTPSALGAGPSLITGANASPYLADLETDQLRDLELNRTSGGYSPDATYAALGDDLSHIPDVAQAINQAARVTRTSPLEHVSREPAREVSNVVSPDANVISQQESRRGGLILSPLALASVNTRSDGKSQIGVRASAGINPLLAYIVEPRPYTQLTPELIYGRMVKKVVPISFSAGGTAKAPIRYLTVPGAPLKIIVNARAAVRGTGVLNKPVLFTGTGLSWVQVDAAGSAEIKITSSAVSEVQTFGTFAKPIPIVVQANAVHEINVVGLGASNDYFGIDDSGDVLGF